MKCERNCFVAVIAPVIDMATSRQQASLQQTRWRQHARSAVLAECIDGDQRKRTAGDDVRGFLFCYGLAYFMVGVFGFFSCMAFVLQKLGF